MIMKDIHIKRVNIVLAIWLLIGVILTTIFLMLSTRIFVKRWIIFTSVILYLFVVALIIILGGKKENEKNY